MKQIALSLAVIVASGAYVWDQPGQRPADGMLDPVMPADTALSPEPAQSPVAGTNEPAAMTPVLQTQPRVLGPRVVTRLPVSGETTSSITATVEKPVIPVSPAAAAAPATNRSAPPEPSFAPTPAQYIPVPQPRPAYPEIQPRIVPVGMKLTARGYADGVYTGPSADAYYGIIQIQALVQGGRLTALKVLKYPSDRRTSISINRQALPMLRDEAISAQSADVDIISGATLTSRAFIQSLRGALKKASS